MLYKICFVLLTVIPRCFHGRVGSIQHSATLQSVLQYIQQHCPAYGCLRPCYPRRQDQSKGVASPPGWTRLMGKILILIVFIKKKFDGIFYNEGGGVAMIRSVVNNVIKEDDRFGVFKSDILFQDCNNSYFKCKSLNSRDS